eukprot:7546783-Pyramimonas_sp.AAC.1
MITDEGHSIGGTCQIRADGHAVPGGTRPGQTFGCRARDSIMGLHGGPHGRLLQKQRHVE